MCINCIASLPVTPCAKQARDQGPPLQVTCRWLYPGAAGQMWSASSYRSGVSSFPSSELLGPFPASAFQDVPSPLQGENLAEKYILPGLFMFECGGSFSGLLLLLFPVFTETWHPPLLILILYLSILNLMLFFHRFQPVSDYASFRQGCFETWASADFS